jgi:effector-binding domain-containing protein
MRPLVPPEKILQMARSGDIEVKTTEPMQVAYLVHQGSYQSMQEAFLRLMRWISDNGYEMTGPPLNVYHNDPMMVRSEEELITEVQIPVRKKG